VAPAVNQYAHDSYLFGVHRLRMYIFLVPFLFRNFFEHIDANMGIGRLRISAPTCILLTTVRKIQPAGDNSLNF
jgi:hypothetical protein